MAKTTKKKLHLYIVRVKRTVLVDVSVSAESEEQARSNLWDCEVHGETEVDCTDEEVESVTLDD